MKKTYLKPACVCVALETEQHLASASSYLPPITDADLEPGWHVLGYIYDTGHEGDDDYIIDYILGEDTPSPTP